MRKQDFYFDLPSELIAQAPLANRAQSRLLVYQRNTGLHAHHQFTDLLNFLNPGDLLALNNTKVIPARLFGMKTTGGQVELLIERIIGSSQCWAQIRASKSPKPGCVIKLEQDWQLEVLEKKDRMVLCQANDELLKILNAIGHIPLPPYITRVDNADDVARYQTVYAQHAGSVAAPTAGLHFDESLLSKIQQAGIRIAYTTLHVGAGTFLPVRVDNISDHVMHHERYTITAELADAVLQTKAAGKRVIAVGTTALRSLESAARTGVLQVGEQETDIFIYPGYTFKICDGLVTNFHLPESTLLMLVSAFIGHEQAMGLYRQAIEARYRFFSYGDACLLI